MSKRGRSIDANAYTKLLKKYNEEQVERLTCECGKIVSKKQYEHHVTTKLHQTLLHYKKLHIERQAELNQKVS